MIWEFHGKSESRQHGDWEPLGSVISPDRQTPPLPSTHAAWILNSDLVVVELKSGDRLQEHSVGEYSFWRMNKNSSIDGNYRPVQPLPKVQIHFQWKDKQLSIILAGEQDDTLAALARKTLCERVCIDLNGVSVSFSLDSQRHWAATIDWEREQPLPTEIALASIAGSIPAPASWKWIARSMRLIDREGNTLDVRQMTRTPESAVRMVFDSPVPHGLLFARRWSFDPMPGDASGEYAAKIKDGAREITCLEFFNAQNENHGLFTASGFEAEVDVTAWNAKAAHYFALLNGQGLVEPKQKATDKTLSFGPPEPYVIGSGESPDSVYVRRETRYDVYKSRAFKSGSLPAPPLTATNLILFIRPDRADKVIAGMFKAAVDVPAGHWVCKRHLGVGKHFVSWNGLVDQVDVSPIPWNSTKRMVARFSNGFELTPQLWFAGPFLGVATTEESKWWANAMDPKGAKLARRGSKFKQITSPEQWAVDGRWVEITTNGAVDKNGEFLEQSPTHLVLFSGNDSSEYSGPVLEVTPDRTCPKVVGWLASVADNVELSFGNIKLGSEEEDRIHLKPDEDPESKQVSEKIKKAFREARKNSYAPEGEVDGVYWRRQGGTIWITDLESIGTGIYVLENMA